MNKLQRAIEIKQAVEARRAAKLRSLLDGLPYAVVRLYTSEQVDWLDAHGFATRETSDGLEIGVS